MSEQQEKTSPPVGSLPGLPLIEVGIVTVGHFDAVDREAIKQAGQAFRLFLQQRFPEFNWCIARVRREDLAAIVRDEPSALLEEGSQIREAYGWDYGFIVTSADLKARYKPYALAALSNALDLAVISTNRIDPQSYQAELNAEERLQVLNERLKTLMLYAFGHLNGLNYRSEEAELIPGLQNIDAMPSHTDASPPPAPVLTDEQCDAMRDNLHQTADLRLEEQEKTHGLPLVYFYLQSAWINRHEIANAVRQARPWQFPVRLVRLSAAALSIVFILLLTAETWHLALFQTPGRAVVLLLLTLISTTIFVTFQQSLFVQRALNPRSEQSVITNVSATGIVLLGMFSTTLFLLSISLLFTVSLYPAALITSWTDSVIQDVRFVHYVMASLFVTTLGLLIGALGASFEEQYYFRHIVFVDEEV